MTPQSLFATSILYTIGHSNHSLERFLELLRMHEITLTPGGEKQWTFNLKEYAK